VWGNDISGESISVLTKVLRKNNWLLGLNLGNNKLSEESLNYLVKELSNNTVLEAVLLRENPGFNEDIAKRLYGSLLSKSSEVNEKKESFELSGKSRLNKVSNRVSWLLKGWMRLQCEETRDIIKQSLSHSLVSKTSFSAIQKSLSREQNRKELYRPYSAFSYLHEDDDDNEEPFHQQNYGSSGVDDDPMLLYDLEGDYPVNGKSLTNGFTRNSKENSKFHDSLLKTEKFIQEPYRSFNFDQLEYSKGYVPNDELDKAVPTISPSNANNKKSKNFTFDEGGWEYWPANNTNGEGNARYVEMSLIFCSHFFLLC
jgi:hypothetical protein